MVLTKASMPAASASASCAKAVPQVASHAAKAAHRAVIGGSPLPARGSAAPLSGWLCAGSRHDGDRHRGDLHERPGDAADNRLVSRDWPRRPT